MVGCSFISKADTVDFCHVYYNHAKRWDFINYNGQYKIKIKSADVKMEDSIQIFYFDDTPCYGCGSKIFLENSNYRFFIPIKNDCFSIAITDLIQFKKKINLKELKVFYFENPKKEPALQIFIFDIE